MAQGICQLESHLCLSPVNNELPSDKRVGVGVWSDNICVSYLSYSNHNKCSYLTYMHL